MTPTTNAHRALAFCTTQFHDAVRRYDDRAATMWAEHAMHHAAALDDGMFAIPEMPDREMGL